MRVSVFGAGYVGLVTATCLASVGHSVICVDVDRRRVLDLSRGNPGFHEPGLGELMVECMERGSLRFTTSHEHAVRNSLVHMIAVGTPPRLDGSADVSQVLAAAHTIGAHLEKFGVVVVKSTVPVGTNESVSSVIIDALDGRDEQVQFAVASNPEFLREGKAVEDFLRPDRVVVGTEHKRAFDVLEELYGPILGGTQRLMRMSTRSAELAKYACNSMLATRVSFMNEFARLADSVGADILDIQRVMGSDSRIGPQFLNAGVGFGGSCFPKDLKAAIHLAETHQQPSEILDAVLKTNDDQHVSIVETAAGLLGDLRGRTVAVLGLAFKPDTDDVREAPSLAIIRRLVADGARVKAHDPVVRWLSVLSSFPTASFEIVDDPYAAATGADVLMLVTEWSEYRDLDLVRLTNVMANPLVLDGRNMWSRVDHDGRGYHYRGVGRGMAVRNVGVRTALAG